jgi:hypothetical protein
VPLLGALVSDGFEADHERVRLALRSKQLLLWVQRQVDDVLRRSRIARLWKLKAQLRPNGNNNTFMPPGSTYHSNEDQIVGHPTRYKCPILHAEQGKLCPIGFGDAWRRQSTPPTPLHSTPGAATESHH